ncbi:unnamed protein product [Acanthosepion pharaonis]|uniref:TLC domain-containing protein n=1 Tax=Acanthosepion pharaonis TaxID=158019 RepID=A0A812CUD7_ACAPH|nr:unnamed protein product [Sepia pharaonis]
MHTHFFFYLSWPFIIIYLILFFSCLSFFFFILLLFHSFSSFFFSFILFLHSSSLSFFFFILLLFHSFSSFFFSFILFLHSFSSFFSSSSFALFFSSSSFTEFIEDYIILTIFLYLIINITKSLFVLVFFFLSLCFHLSFSDLSFSVVLSLILSPTVSLSRSHFLIFFISCLSVCLSI